MPGVTCAYKSPIVEDWLDADGLILLESWAREGYTIDDIAMRIGIVKQTLWAWMKKYPEIKAAISNGRELVDYKVENALLKAALGYKTKEVRVATIIRNGKTIETQRETLEKEAAPNVAACQAWLYNRQPKKWKNMNSRANILDEIDEDTSIHITVERAGPNECKTNTTTPVSSSFEEVDTDWQNDVNKSVTLRGMSDEEKAEAKRKASQEEKVSTGKQPSGGAKASKKFKNGTGNSIQSATSKDAKAHAQQDVDYWPDDWEDEDGDWE